MRVDVNYFILFHSCVYGKVHFNIFIFMHLLICILQGIECVNLWLIGSCVLIPCRGERLLKSIPEVNTNFGFCGQD